MAYVLIPEEELNLKNNEIKMTSNDVSELLEYSDVIEKWLKKNINRIQSQLALCQLQWREQEAYISINTIKKLIEDLKNTEKNYRDFLTDIENKKSQ